MDALLCGSLLRPVWVSLVANAVARAVALDASCSANSGCRHLNLQGKCCPGDNGVMLECCKVTTTTSTPSASCSAHPACHKLGLTGSCCPGASGILLGCCEGVVSQPSTTMQGMLRVQQPSHNVKVEGRAVGHAEQERPSAHLAEHANDEATTAPLAGGSAEHHVDPMSVVGTILLTCLILSVIGWISWCMLGEKRKEKLHEVAAPLFSRGRSLIAIARQSSGGSGSGKLEASAELGDAGCGSEQLEAPEHGDTGHSNMVHL
eukprot:TRINITY_DN66911_c0_g1_i1.p1 TRINITY_DN66911_c0_g1~~TRINITY_DN66911_c0_g1_i1.p1  ORF type:complete len:282 (+),score=33.45 TRINITY_DN66911_c0_g1_i1:61-846(+)